MFDLQLEEGPTRYLKKRRKKDTGKAFSLVSASFEKRAEVLLMGAGKTTIAEQCETNQK